MVRLENVSEGERRMFSGAGCPTFSTNPFVSGPPLSQRRVAIVTTGGLHTRNDTPFLYDDADYYRIIPGNVQANDLVMSHISSGFDRSGSSTGFFISVSNPSSSIVSTAISRSAMSFSLCLLSARTFLAVS